MATSFWKYSTVAIAIVTTYCVVSSGKAISSPQDSFNCPITRPNADKSVLENAFLQTTLWQDGKIVFTPDGPGYIGHDGSLGMKWPWVRLIRGQLRITGRRLDADAPPLHSEIPEGYGDLGFQPSTLVFSSSGCWEVTGAVAESSLRLVTLVVVEKD